MRTLIPALLAGLLLVGQPARAAEPGDQGSISFACKDAVDMEGFGLLLEGGADDTIMSEAADQELENGKCVYFPNGEMFTFIAIEPGTGDLKQHEVWSVKLQHGTPAYMLHLISGRPS